ncbi:hypothetical protein FGO68_gene12361 [Halteria grandinella]|uniref:Uncharacterized protein n=1 Tax=Halteria grandinella TaxID=5974 RepID=A0A8J8NWV2_HALGN|nr:hypothetical protein FGO68_gene12361 [Halteria grandinella]
MRRRNRQSQFSDNFNFERIYTPTRLQSIIYLLSKTSRPPSKLALQNEETLRMQIHGLRQEVHHPLLSQTPHLYPRTRQAIHLRDLLQEVRSWPISEGTHLHPYRAKAFQVPLRRLHQGIQTSWQTFPAQEASPEQDLHCSESEEKVQRFKELLLQ